MYRLAGGLGLLGLIAATALIVWSGWAQVVLALTQAGWGIPFIAVAHFMQMTISAAGWRVVTPKPKPSYVRFIYFMWIRASVNSLMPVARIGGEFAAVRLMTSYGIDSITAIASTVVELTLSVAAVFLFVVVGALLFALRVSDQNVTAQLVWGLALSAPLIAALAAVQKIGFFGLLSKLFRLMFRDKWASLTGNSEKLDQAVTDIYATQTGPVICFFLQLLAWVFGSLEIYLSLYFLGHPLPPMEAFMLEALIQGSSSIAFAIPGALGVQEAGFLLFGNMLGLSPDVAAALAVMRRCRDLICYIPGLLAWQAHEGKKLLRK